MAVASLRSEERTGLVIAFLLHVALVAALILQPRPDAVVPVPERMTVSLAEDVAMEATGPVISQDSRQAIAPEISDEIAPPEQSEPEPAPEPRPQPRPEPQPKARAAPKAKPTRPKPPAKRDAKPAPRTPAKAASKAPAKPEPKKGGGSRIGADFLKGLETGRSDAPAPASRIGAAERASLAQAIARQLKPKWTSPQGADAELLVTVLAFDLNPDGSLAGAPRVVSQSGITAANRPQAARHAELAIRAVRLAAPFDLPPELYNAWKRVSAFRFDRKLSQ